MSAVDEAMQGAGNGPVAGAAPPRPIGHWFEDMPLRRAHLLAAAALFVAFVGGGARHDPRERLSSAWGSWVIPGVRDRAGR
ncbi:hypothetical protein [Streptomyces sp. NPDC097640]|uniref:hypothetical protein n=1 Tax=Streptomyces sp. NPDC097640 TaxID=3157229 RepID=UPI00331BBC6E